MTGALLQLVAIGNKDIFITGNPQISYFKCVYKRHSNFAIQSKSLNFDSVQYLSYDNPTKLIIKVPHYGSLISKMNLEFMLPDIYSNSKLEFKWIDNIGTSIINYAKIFINDNIIEEIEGRYINIYNNLVLTDEQLKIYNELIGNVPDIYNPYLNIENKYKVGERNKTKPSIKSRNVSVPLSFWFSKYRGQEIPLVSLDNAKITLEIELKPIKHLYTIIDSNANERGKGINLQKSFKTTDQEISFNSSIKNGNDEYLYNHTTDTVYHARRKRPESKSEEISNFLEYTGDNRWELKPRLDIEYIYLDDKENKLMKEMDHQYLIERVVNNEFIGLSGKKIIELKLFNPTKELYILPYRDDTMEKNQFTNYTNLDYVNQENSVYDYQSYFYGLCNTKYVIDNAKAVSANAMARKAKAAVDAAKELARKNKDDKAAVDAVVEAEAAFVAAQQIANAAQVVAANSDPINLLGLFRTDSNRSDNIIVKNKILDTLDTIYYNVERLQAYTNLDIHTFINNWNYRLPEDIPYINKYNYKFFTSNIIDTLEIKFNGDIRLSGKSEKYYSKIIPYVHHTNSHLNGPLIYSFSINPEKFQPSGACNFTNIKDVRLEIDFKKIYNYEVKNKQNVKYNLKIYSTTYNILKINDGICQLLFSN